MFAELKSIHPMYKNISLLFSTHSCSILQTRACKLITLDKVIHHMEMQYSNAKTLDTWHRVSMSVGQLGPVVYNIRQRIDVTLTTNGYVENEDTDSLMQTFIWQLLVKCNCIFVKICLSVSVLTVFFYFRMNFAYLPKKW